MSKVLDVFELYEKLKQKVEDFAVSKGLDAGEPEGITQKANHVMIVNNFFNAFEYFDWDEKKVETLYEKAVEEVGDNNLLQVSERVADYAFKTLIEEKTKDGDEETKKSFEELCDLV